ncbi:MAG: hypothetical protein R2809_09595 [Flavobacteriales bacterium]
MIKRYLFFLLIISASLLSCREDAFPKPVGYFRITLPEHNYVTFDSTCAMAMDVPSYSKVELFEGKSNEDSCWFNVYYPRFDARIYCTYLKVNGNFDILINDAYQFAAKHEMKASALRRTMISHPEKNVEGLLYDIEGETASQVQFFVTDSTKNFLRGSLYFNNKNRISIQYSVIEFVREDILHMVNSVEWN